jgi:hypothetical protein
VLLGLRKLVQFLLSLGNGGNTSSSETEPSETPEPSETGGLPDGGEVPQWLAILQVIFYYLLLIGAIVIGIIIIVSVIYSLYRRFYANRRSGPDVLESLLPKFASQVQESVRRGQIRWERAFGRSPAQKIRRSYFRLIEELCRYGLTIEEGATPASIAESAVSLLKIAPAAAEALAAMTAIYEKARYGPDICTTDDARRMLELNRQFHQKRELT